MTPWQTERARRVAQLTRQATAAGQHPAAVVALALGISPATARRRIAEARAGGFLDETTTAAGEEGA